MIQHKSAAQLSAVLDATDRAVLKSVNDDETVELLKEFISADTENPPGRESRLVRRLVEAFELAGVKTELHEVSPERENLEARLGPRGGRTLLINCHTDTMPAGTGWSTPPQTPVVRGGRMYGRGACDVKGGLAACTQAMLAVSRAGIPLTGQVILDAVVDEEASALGTLATIELGRHADFAIVMEPTDLRVVAVGNGQVNFEINTAGIAAHGSSPEAGRNAIADAAAIVAAIEAEARQLAHHAHPRTGAPTWNVGTIEGGVQTSIVPARCRVTVDRRITPGQSVDDAIADLDRILERARAERPGLQVSTRVLVAIPPLDQPEEMQVSTALRACVKAVSGHDHGYGGLRATSDAAHLIRAGIPTVVFGPGSITESAHRPDEFVPLDELHAATRSIALLIVRLLGGSEPIDVAAEGGSQ